ncbi:MAG: Hsp20/alpha crystallin family protein [Nitrolancea sp.]
MSISPRSRFLDMDTLRDRFDRLFSDLTNGTALSEERTTMPLDVQETDDGVLVKASLPGVKPEDIAVEVRNGVLTIKGESHEHRDETRGRWHVVERRVGSVERSVTLPTPVDESSGDAKYEDGVLTVAFKKSVEKPGKKIEVNSGTAPE